MPTIAIKLSLSIEMHYQLAGSEAKTKLQHRQFRHADADNALSVDACEC